MKKTQQLVGIILISGSLGSCTTFHTPLSRGLVSGPSMAQMENSQIDSQSLEIQNELSSPRGPVFDWPVDSARLTRGYLPNKRRPHLGLDLAAPRGTPILTSKGGTVIYTGREFRGFGKMILIESGDGWATLYAHLDRIVVAEGQRVNQGEVLGEMGRTGRATGYHLHFEIRKQRGPVDPLPLLPDGYKIAKMIKSR